MTRRRWPAVFLLSTAGCLTVLSSVGCAENESTLFIVGVQVLESGDCSAKAEENAAVWLSGLLDTALRSSYQATLVVGNQLVARGSRDQVRTETARVSLRGAEVEVNTAEGENLAEFTVNGTGFINAGTGEDAAFGVMGVTLVPPGLVSAPAELNVGVRVFGDTLGGQEVESNQLFFPIFVCDGCLISLPADAQDISDPGTCVAGESSSNLETPCRIGQDEPVDCRACLALDACRHPSGG